MVIVASLFPTWDSLAESKPVGQIDISIFFTNSKCFSQVSVILVTKIHYSLFTVHTFNISFLPVDAGLTVGDEKFTNKLSLPLWSSLNALTHI